MSAAIDFYVGQSNAYALTGSGIGFYGSSGFGASVAVAAWQGRTFITDSTGVSQGPEGWNNQYLSSPSGIIGQAGSGVALTCIPNYQATVNIRFTNDTAVRAQNVQMYIYDRTSINNDASGVTTAAAEIIHPTTTQLNNGSGDSAWIFPNGSGVVMSLAPSPGVSGLYAGNGSNGSILSSRHDWFVALSSSPLSVGAKNLYGLFVSLEYL